MIGAYASLAAVVVASVVIGQAVLALCGRREFSWHSAPVGLALVLAIAGLSVELPGHVTAVAVALALSVVAAAVVLFLRPPEGMASGLAAGLPAALLALLAASVPFIAAGTVGILGVGLVNDDMASHLLLGSWLDERFSPEPVLLDQGYPLGPHALAAGLAKVFGADLVEAFAGITLAIPVLTALLAFGALHRLRPLTRTVVAVVTALPYLITAYLAQEAFKEPIMALFVLAFALWLPSVRDWRDAVPLGVLAAGTVYVYSFPGLAWLAGTVLAWGLVEVFARRGRAAVHLRPALWPTLLAIGVALVLIAPELDRVREFADFRALDPERANEGGLGNLRGHLSPLEALGVWPTSEFRLSAGAGSLPAAIFYAGALLGALALCLGLPRWIRRHGWAVPGALMAAAAIYLVARGYGTVYTSAKALAVAAPLVALIGLGGLLAGPRGWRHLLAAGLVAGMAVSSFLVLRQAPVGPTDHMEELAEIRPLVEGEKLLFLGRDNFVLYELRGSKPYTHVRNFYDPYFVEPNFELRDVASKFDFDALEAKELAKFPYVITTRAAYASGPPPGYDPVRWTESYVLWRAGGSLAGRGPVETGPEPTGELSCDTGRPDEVAMMPDGPVRVEAEQWSAATIENGSPAMIKVELPPGGWDVSLQYDSTRPIELRGPHFAAELPGNLDYRGVAPFWPAGAVDTGVDETLEFTASVEEPPMVGRLLGAKSVAHLGAIAFTPAWAGGHEPGLKPPYPGSGTRFVTDRVECGVEADWTVIRAAGRDERGDDRDG